MNIIIENISSIEKLLSNNFKDNSILEDYKINPFAKILIAKVESEIVGFLYYSDIYDRLEINRFEVYEKYRKNGIGEKIISQLINNTQYNISLEVNCENVPAINLYKKVGFIEVAIRKGYYNGVDGILMEYQRNKVK